MAKWSMRPSTSGNGIVCTSLRAAVFSAAATDNERNIVRVTASFCIPVTEGHFEGAHISPRIMGVSSFQETVRSAQSWKNELVSRGLTNRSREVRRVIGDRQRRGQAGRLDAIQIHETLDAVHIGILDQEVRR